MDLFNYIYQYLAIEIMGSPLLFGFLVIVIAVAFLLISQAPKWAVFLYSTPIILVLTAPGYEPVLIPEWVFYIVLIFLGLMWGFVIIRIKNS